MNRNAPSRGFTLIELLIVVGIILVIAPVAHGFTTAMETARIRLEERNAAIDAAERTLALWREDVALSETIAIGDEGRAMAIERRSGDGGTVEIRYGLDGGRLMRRTTASPLAERLAESAEGLRFEPAGRGCRMAWEFVAKDGLQTRRIPFGAIAAPLALPAERTAP